MVRRWPDALAIVCGGSASLPCTVDQGSKSAINSGQVFPAGSDVIALGSFARRHFRQRA